MADPSAFDASAFDPPAFVAGQVVTVFRSHLRADAGADYETTADEMLRRAQAVPGFVDFKTFVADDGERVSIATFADRAAHQRWAADPHHHGAQEAGRARFYDHYSIQVADCTGARRFDRR